MDEQKTETKPDFKEQNRKARAARLKRKDDFMEELSHLCRKYGVQFEYFEFTQDGSKYTQL